jgi:hypothetical protein
MTYRKCCVAAGAILLVLAVGKLVALVGNEPDTDYIDPLFGLPATIVLLAASFLEVGVAERLFRSRSEVTSALVMTSFAVLMMGYRFFQLAFPQAKPCPCLGALRHIVPLKNEWISAGLWTFLAAMFVVGATRLYSLLWKSPTNITLSSGTT